MKYYRDPATGELFAYEADGSQDDYIKPNLVPISDEEFAALTAPTQSDIEAIARAKRDQLLAEQVDPIVCNPFRFDCLEPEMQLAIIAYRQALLDITQQAGFPHEIVWPTAPC